MMDWKPRAALCGAALLLCGPLPAQQAGEDRPPYRVERATSEIEIDGALDEPAWSAAAVVELLYETRPAENQPPPVATRVLFAYDDANLYVAFDAKDPDPSAIRAHLADRDTAWSDDFVGIVLDPFNDERRAFEFFINPLGVQMDMFMDDVGGNEDESWDAIWSSAGRITETGFIVEVAIPWSSLRFPRTAGEQTWGFDALRFYPREHRHRIASQPMDRNVTCYLCQVSKITGLSGITPGRNIEVVPTVTSSRTDRREDFPSGGFEDGSVETDLGVTARWGITPNLALNAAINPDFSQVEADAAQLDVNAQFALFFPEKRPFFLEGADFFRTPFEAVFTRNVADPSWGAKLTGKEGRNALGVFVAEDERTNLILPGSQGSSAISLPTETTDAVLRYRRDLGSSSALGVLFTGREGDEYSNRVGGLDGLYRFDDSNALRAQALFSQTEYPGSISAAPSGLLEDPAFLLSYTHSSRNWRGGVRYEDVGREFRADMGFMPRVDYAFLSGNLDRVWYGRTGAPITQWSFGGAWEQAEDQRGQLLGREFELSADLHGPRQSFLEVEARRGEQLFNGVAFDQTSANLFFEMEPTGKFFFSVFTRVGDEIDFVNTQAGEMLLVEPSVRFNLGLHLRTRITHAFQRLDVPGGRLFEANLTQVNAVYQFNVRTFLRAILQYTDVRRDPGHYIQPVDESTERLFSQLLFSYKLNPQTVLFVGYSDSALGDERVDLTRSDRTLFLKLGYAWLP